MRAIFRAFLVGIALFLFWPFLLIRKHPSKKVDFANNSLIIANHYSNLDPLLIYLLVPFKERKKLYFITNEGVKKNPFTRIFCYLFNCLYVNEENIAHNMAAVREAIDLLKEGQIVVIFPEGVIRPSKNGFFEFNRGFVFMAKRAKSSIYPLYIYPRATPFTFSDIYFCDKVNYEDIKDKDDIVAAIHVQAKIMNKRAEIDSVN